MGGAAAVIKHSGILIITSPWDWQDRYFMHADTAICYYSIYTHIYTSVVY
jgi:hypothetical protein